METPFDISILPTPFLDVFVKVKIRVFSDEKLLDGDIQTHLFFHTKNNVINLSDIEKVTKNIISIYGEDDTNTGELDNYEIENIKKYSYWLGRRYDFDQEHKLWNNDNTDDKTLYSLSVEYDEFMNEGLCLSVVGYNELVKYF